MSKSRRLNWPRDWNGATRSVSVLLFRMAIAGGSADLEVDRRTAVGASVDQLPASVPQSGVSVVVPHIPVLPPVGVPRRVAGAHAPLNVYAAGGTLVKAPSGRDGGEGSESTT